MLANRVERELVLSIHEAATSPEAWAQVAANINGLLNGQSCALGTFNFQSHTGALSISAGGEKKYLTSYQEQYNRLDIWMQKEENYTGEQIVHLGKDIVSDRDLVESPFYSGWLRPQYLHHRVSAVLWHENRDLHYLAVMRSAKAKSFSQQEAAACQKLAPHLRAGLRLRRHLAVLESERDVVTQVLDRLPIGVLLCDPRGSVVMVNETARRIIAARDGLAIQRGRLVAARQGESDRLQRLIVGAGWMACGQGDEPGGTLNVSRPSGSRSLPVLVSPLRKSAKALGECQAVAAVFVSDPEWRVETRESLLSELYGLTRSESRLAIKIVQGHSLEEAAMALRVSIETGRSYMKRVLSKTGVRRQAELVRLVLLGPTALG